MNKTLKTIKKESVLSKILNEVQQLREEVDFFMPLENLNDYVSPSKIRRSYIKALKQYPPRA